MIVSLLGAALLLAGAGFVTLAAIGIVRLPDPFVRMHAATKTGTVGAGLTLLGLVLASGNPDIAIRAAMIFLFLLATVPLASHLLGRAAYIGGAPLWRGTIRDDLAEVLGPQRAEGASDGTAPVTAFSPPPSPAGTARIDRPLRTRPAAAPCGGKQPLDQLLLLLLAGEHGEQAIREGVQLAARHNATLVGLSLVDTGLIGKIDGAERAALLAECRTRAADAVQVFEMTAADAGLRYEVQHEEGDPVEIVAALRRDRDLVMSAASGWFHHGVRLPWDILNHRPPSLFCFTGSSNPVLMLSGGRRRIMRILVIDDGSDALMRLLQWALGRSLWQGARFVIVPHHSDGSSPTRRDEMRALAHAYGGEIEWVEPSQWIAPDRPLDPVARSCDAIVLSRPPTSGHTLSHGSPWLDEISPGWRGSVLLP